MRKVLKIDFVRFCIIGVLGFVINFALLTLFYKIVGLPLFIAQIISGEIALFNNFVFHNNWTYKNSGVIKSLSKLIVQFHVSSWIAIVGTAGLVTIGVNSLHLPLLIALVIAGLIALAWNFVWTKYVIWRKKPHGKLSKNNYSSQRNAESKVR